MHAWKRHLKNKPPVEEVCLGEKAVACDCDPRLHRSVLLPARDIGVHACLCCGTVTASTSRGDDGRYTGNPSWAWFTVPLPPDLIEWLGGWPRAKVTRENARWPMAEELVRQDFLYLPACSQCQDLSACAALEARLAHDQAPQSIATRLRDQVWPRRSAPAALPSALQGFQHTWEALQLQPDSDLPRLIFLAQLRNSASPIAADLLRQRTDAFQVMVEALRSEDPVWQSAGYAMARDFRPADSRLSGVVIEILQSLSLAPLPDVPGRVISCSRYEALLVIIAELQLASAQMTTALREFKRRLLGKDLHLVEYINIVLRELQGESTQRAGSRRESYLP